MRVRVAALSSVIAGLVALIGGTSCRPRYAPDEPVKMGAESCCKLADEAMTKFAGCRMVNRCREDEPVWLRGAINCGPVDEARCAGGRCCELQPMYGSPDAVLNWDASINESKAKAAPGKAPKPAATPETVTPDPATPNAATPDAAPPAAEPDPATPDADRP